MRGSVGNWLGRLRPRRRTPDKYSESWSRYHTLLETFERQARRKRHLMEIGTYGGGTAARLIDVAKRYEPVDRIHYWGFDLFEDMDDRTLSLEISKRLGTTKDEVLEFLVRRTGLPPSHIHLCKGNTRETLWSNIDLPEMDIIFIDGGHSFETVSSDWRACERLLHRDTLVFFDDYYQFPFGPRQVIDDLDPSVYDVQLLDPQEVFGDPYNISPDGRLAINIVKITPVGDPSGGTREDGRKDTVRR